MANLLFENIICTNCGGQVEKNENSIICKVCGSVFERKQLDSKVFVNLQQAENERQSANFSKAKKILQKTIKDYPNEDLSDVYWNLLLCNQNIIFETDGKGENFPSFYNINSSDIFESEEYKKAIENAKNFHNNKEEIYEKLARQIEQSKNMYKDISASTKPYDIFICFKKSDENGNTTRDTQLALDIYNELSNEYKIFFSEKSLANIKSLYREYEPNIYYGLYTAKVMLLICSKKEYLESTWLKNEWNRFTKINNQNKNACIIPILARDFNPSDLPENLWHIQGIKEDIKLIANLREQLNSIIHPVNELEELKKQQEELLQKQHEETEKQIRDLKKSLLQNSSLDSNNSQTTSLIKRAEMFLEDKDFDNASIYAERILDSDPECSEGYIIKLLAKLKYSKDSDLIVNKILIENTNEYKKAIKFANAEYKKYLNELVNKINNRITETKDLGIYNVALELIKQKRYDEAILKLEEIKDYKDSLDKIDFCKNEINFSIYKKALELMQNKNYVEAMSKFSTIENYKDSTKKIEECKKIREEERNKKIYNNAIKHINENEHFKAIGLLEQIKDYKDSADKIEYCKKSLYEKALKMMKTNSFDTAITIFESLKDYSDSNIKVQECKNFKKLKDQETTYNNALKRLTQKKLTEEMFLKSIEDMKSIKEYKDAYEQSFKIKKDLEVWKKEQLKKRIITTLITTILIISTTLLFLTVNVFIPQSKYSKAESYYQKAQYIKAYDIYSSINYKDSKMWANICLASIDFSSEDFEIEDTSSTINNLLKANIPVCINYLDIHGDIDLSLKYTKASNFGGIRDVYNFVNKQEGVSYGWILDNYKYEEKQGTKYYKVYLKLEKSLTTYTITYHLNGGTLEKENPTAYTIDSNVITLQNPTRKGYEFAGWTGTNLSEKTKEVKIPRNSKGNRTYSANWTAIDYKITYKLNGGTNNSYNPISYNIQTKVTLYYPIKLGYEFIGWTNETISSPTKEVVIQKGTTGELNFVANWKVQQYTITYELNGGTNDNQNPNSYTIVDRVELKEPTKFGYTFKGWSTSTTGTNLSVVVVLEGEVGNKTYYANWSPINYNVNYTLNGANINPNPTIYTIESNFSLEEPTKTGYKFMGWTNETISSPTKEVEIKKGTTGELNFIANWEIINYTITYGLNGGVNNSQNPTTYTIETETIILQNPTRDYYNFVKWTLNGSTVTKITKGTTGNKTLVANWSPISYTITYNLNGGTNSSSNPTNYNYETNNFTLKNPTKSYSTFLGWTSDTILEPTKDITIPKGSNGNLVFTANWKGDEFTITFNSNGGSNVEPITQEYDTVVIEPQKPTLELMSFAGWYLDNDSFSQSFTFTKMPAQNITLYAKWIDYEILFESNAENNELKLSYLDEINASLFNAKAIDTDGEELDLSISVNGEQVAGNTVYIKFKATGKYETDFVKTISAKVYGKPEITYNTEKDYINLTDTINASLFNAQGLDSFSQKTNITLSVKEQNYKAGDLVTIEIIATDVVNNKTTCVINNIKVYGNPIITCNTENLKSSSKTSLTSEDINASAIDTFGDSVQVVVNWTNNTDSNQLSYFVGNTITLKLTATDNYGNTSELSKTLKVYGNPIFNEPTTTNFKVTDQITIESLGLVAKDSFSQSLTNITLEKTSGEIKGGSTLTYLATVTDIVGNTTTKTFTVKIYDNPTIEFNTNLTEISESSSITTTLFEAKAKDSFKVSLSVSVVVTNLTIENKNYIIATFSATDCVGNIIRKDSQKVLVYSKNITLNYSTNKKYISINSKGEEFNATAIDCYNQPISTKIVITSGTLKGGNTVSLKIVATDCVGNTKESEVLTNIKVYGIPQIVFNRDYDYIYENDNIEFLFSGFDSFDNELSMETFTSTIEGNINKIVVTFKDRANNIATMEKELLIINENIYYVYLDANGGSVNPSTRELTPLSSFTLPIPTRKGYEFAGWTYNDIFYTDYNGESIIDFDLSSGITFVANWSIISYSITYELNGGVNNPSNVDCFTVEDLVITLNEPTKSSNNGYYYKFEGWYLEETFNTQITEITENYLQDLILYAKWEEVPLYTRSGNTITFGSYPQTKVSDSSLTSALKTKAGTLPTSSNSYAWTDYGYYISSSVKSYMWYIDLEYSNNKYRGVYFTSYRPYYTEYSSSSSNSEQYDNGYYTSTVYWFKYEPITWTIKEESNGYATIVCNMILDSQDWHYKDTSSTINGKTVYANNYEYSHIRSWLNNTFYNTAFNELEQAIIQTTTVDNSASSTIYSGNSHACNNTSDKIYLLSYNEATKYFISDSQRQKKGTDYAKCQGLYVSTSSSYYGNSYWWLRSPDHSDCDLSLFVYGGGSAYGRSDVNDTSIGVLPALKIKL